MGMHAFPTWRKFPLSVSRLMRVELPCSFRVCCPWARRRIEIAWAAKNVKIAINHNILDFTFASCALKGAAKRIQLFLTKA
jgi:hypothetical protein